MARLLKSVQNKSASSNFCFYKVQSHSGIAGDECADAAASYQASQANNDVADTGIHRPWQKAIF
eukprot:914879-Pelagomonas_calceolata.AAC.2